MAKDYNVEIEWKAFELRPEGVDIPPKSPEYMERAKAGVEQMSKQYGIEMKWNDKSSHSRHALEGSKFAELEGLSNEYHEAVFKAHFQQDRTINDMDTLTDIAEEIGLDPQAFREALEDRTYEQQVIAEGEEAKSVGVTGIPCFVAGSQGVMGAQTYEALAKLIQEN